VYSNFKETVARHSDWLGVRFLEGSVLREEPLRVFKIFCVVSIFNFKKCNKAPAREMIRN
jgi:hypothetical protein